MFGGLRNITCMTDIQNKNVNLTNKGRFCNSNKITSSSDCREKKFSQPVNQNKHNHKSCSEVSRENSNFKQITGGF